MLARNQVAGMVTGMGSTLLITWLLDKYKDNQFFLLPVLFCMAFALYCLCGLNICRVVEPAALKRMTNHKILKQALITWRIPHIRHQIYVGSAMNLWIAMIPSINIIAMKKCFGFSDSNIMLFGFVQTISVIVASALYKNITLRFGPAKVLVGICPLIWVLSLYWIFIPGEISLWAALPPFILTGAISSTISTGLGNYFSNTVSNVYQVGGTFWVFVITGGLVGLVGMIMNPILLKSIEFVTKSDGIAMYRGFFIITAILFAGLIFAPISLVKRGKTAK